MYHTNYKISDFCIDDKPVPLIIADRILLYHIIPLNIVQDNTTFDVRISLKSGWRPWTWEIDRGRSGKGQHAFGQGKFKISDSKGACDITCEDFKENKKCLLEALIEHTDYLRIVEYNNFYHCDYKDLHNGKRRIFESNSASEWKLIKFI